MKIYFLTIEIALTLLIPRDVFAQEKLEKGIRSNQILKSDEVEILFIDKIKQEINANLNSYSKIDKINNKNEYYYSYKDNSDLKLIVIYSKDGNQNLSFLKELYFQFGQLIFAEQITTKTELDIIIDREKMYFENGNLFTWIQSETNVDRNSAKFKKTAVDAKEYAMKLRIENIEKN